MNAAASVQTWPDRGLVLEALQIDAAVVGIRFERRQSCGRKLVLTGRHAA